MSNIRCFRFDTLAWLSSTKIAQMTNAETGAYINLLAHSWNYHDCILPDDIPALCRLSKSSKKVVQRVLEMCFTREANGYRNERLYSEFLKTLYKSEIARRALP